MQVRNDAKIGEKIGFVEARDGDGTSPFNVVKYELVESASSEKSGQYFKVDPDKGEIFILDDLTQELFDEYKVRRYEKSLHKSLEKQEVAIFRCFFFYHSA